MPVIKTKHLSADVQRPRTPADGTSLEEQMNAFLATLTFSAVMDVQTSAITGQFGVKYLGLVIYQE